MCAPSQTLRQVHNRFVDSFKKQFMEQESRCVRGRIHERRKLNFACLVAMHEVSEMPHASAHVTGLAQRARTSHIMTATTQYL